MRKLQHAALHLDLVQVRALRPVGAHLVQALVALVLARAPYHVVVPFLPLALAELAVVDKSIIGYTPIKELGSESLLFFIEATGKITHLYY
jgi:hypothetical protein